MDVFNKLKSTVTSTVNQISSVLPGNPVTREYDITGHIGSAGQGMLFELRQFSFSLKWPRVLVLKIIIVLINDQMTHISLLKNNKEFVTFTLPDSVQKIHTWQFCFHHQKKKKKKYAAGT